MLGNLLSIEVTAYVPYLVTRLLAGVGAGFGMAIGYAILAEGDGARSVAWFNIGQLGSGWFAIPYFTLLANRHGVGILFGLLAAFAAAVWPLAAWLPRMSARDSAAPASQEPHKDKVSLPGWVAIASVFVFFIGTGAVFGFLSFMGAAWGVAPLAVENDVSKILLVGMCTAAVVAVIGSRFGHVRSYLLAYALMLLALLLFMLLKPASGFLAIAALFYVALTLIVSFQFATVITIDPSSSVAMLVMAADVGAIALGPPIAGYLVTPDYVWVNAFGFVAVALSLLLMVVALRLKAPGKHSPGHPGNQEAT